MLTILLVVGILTVWAPAPWALTLWEASLFLLAAWWAARKLWRGESPASGFLLWPLTAIVAWGCLQMAAGWTVYRYATLQKLLDWAACLAAWWLAVELLRSPALRLGFRRTLLWFAFLLSVASIISHFLAPGRIFWLIPAGHGNFGPFLNRDHYAAFIALLLPLALYEALEDPRILISRTWMTGAMFASVIAGASRAGSALVTLEILAVLLLGLSARLGPTAPLKRTLACVAVPAIAFAAVVGWDALWMRLQDPDPFRGRRELLASSLAMVRDQPWTGFGLGAWPVVYPAYAVTDFGIRMFANHAHNDWAEWAADGGVAMLLLMGLVLGWSLRQALRFPWALGIVAVLCHSMIDFPMQRPAIAVMLFALSGAASAERKNSREAAP